MNKTFGLALLISVILISCKKDDSSQVTSSYSQLIAHTWVLNQYNTKTINASTRTVERDTTYSYTSANGMVLTFYADSTFTLVDNTSRPPFPEKNYYVAWKDSVYLQTSILQHRQNQYTIDKDILVLKAGHVLNNVETDDIFTFYKQ